MVCLRLVVLDPVVERMIRPVRPQAPAQVESTVESTLHPVVERMPVEAQLDQEWELQRGTMMSPHQTATILPPFPQTRPPPRAGWLHQVTRRPPPQTRRRLMRRPQRWRGIV